MEERACYCRSMECETCSAEILDLLFPWTDTLGRNLEAGAAMCRAFELGDKNSRHLYWHGRHLWYPGCGREAR